MTHGDPLGVLKVTLDLYAPSKMPDHSCCTTLPDPKLMCTVVEKLALVSVVGTGPFCCPAGATEEGRARRPPRRRYSSEAGRRVALATHARYTAPSLADNFSTSISVSFMPGVATDRELLSSPTS